MRFNKLTLAGLIAAFGLLFAQLSVAEIYQTKDKDGNPVFSDTPTAGSVEVDLSQENIADPPPDIPRAPREEHSESTANDSDGEGGNVIIIPNSHNEELRVELEEERRYEVLDGEPRHEVRDAELRHKVGDAQPRHKVGDAESRHTVGDAEPRHEVRDAQPGRGR